jgi:uncharacterized protein (TIGR02996 family)
MDLEEGFLADMVLHPHDATPWLVFADWLEERDDHRGELVRLLRLCWDEPRKKAFKDRHARLQQLFASGVRLPLPRYTNSLGMDFVWVPPGHFWMGGHNGIPGVRKVEIAGPFWLGIHPVTQGQWQTVMGSNPSWFSRTGHGADKVAAIPDADLARFPVENVSWHETQEFIAELSKLDVVDGWVYRLPQEEEWEYACRGPITCKVDCAFSFHAGEPSSSLSSERANFHGDYPANADKGPFLARTTTVGAYPANRLGLYDMHGNVWEWTDNTPQFEGIVFRGGSWNSTGPDCNAANGLSTGPLHQVRNRGFRLARVASR